MGLTAIYARSATDSHQIMADLQAAGFDGASHTNQFGTLVEIPAEQVARFRQLQRRNPAKWGEPDRNLARLGTGWVLDPRGYRYQCAANVYLIAAQAPTPSNKHGWVCCRFENDQGTNGQWYPSLKQLVTALNRDD